METFIACCNCRDDVDTDLFLPGIAVNIGLQSSGSLSDCVRLYACTRTRARVCTQYGAVEENYAARGGMRLEFSFFPLDLRVLFN